MTYDEQLSQTEREFGVNIDQSDQSGGVHVYVFTNDGDRLGFDFNDMNPAVDSVRAISRAINDIRNLANQRAGRPNMTGYP